MIRIVAEREQNLTLFEGQGTMTASEVVRAVREYWAAPPPEANTLWDVRAANVAGITAQTLREAIGIGVKATPPEHLRSRRVAFVASTTLQYGICRMAASFLDASKHAMRPEVFQSMEAARGWLAGQPSGYSVLPMMA